MTRYATDTKYVEYVATNGRGKHSKGTTNKLSAQSVAKKWSGTVLVDTYVKTPHGDLVHFSRKPL